MCSATFFEYYFTENMRTHAYLICPLRVAISVQQSVKVKGLGWASFLGEAYPSFLHPSKLELELGSASAIFVCGDKNVYLFRNLIMRYNSLPPCVFHFALRVNSVRVFFTSNSNYKNVRCTQTRQNVCWPHKVSLLSM